MFTPARLVNGDSIPTHLRCSGCSQLLLNCFQTPHGCRLCQSCVSNELLPNRSRLCPCNKVGCRDYEEVMKLFVSQESCSPDLATRKEVLKLAVHCPNEGSGCQKQLPYKLVDSHLANECESQLVTCDDCSMQVVQFELNGSHRDLQSSSCCSELRAPCPLCGDSSNLLRRLEFEEHLRSCPERRKECKYRVSVGCQATLSMSQLDEHYSSGADRHLELTVQRFEQLTELKDAELREVKQSLRGLVAREEMKDAELQDVKQSVQGLVAREEMKDAELQDVKQRLDIVLSELERMKKKLIIIRRLSMIEESQMDLRAQRHHGNAVAEAGAGERENQPVGINQISRRRRSIF